MMIEETYLHFMFLFTVNKELPSIYLAKLNKLSPAGISKKSYDLFEFGTWPRKHNGLQSQENVAYFYKNMGG